MMMTTMMMMTRCIFTTQHILASSFMTNILYTIQIVKLQLKFSVFIFQLCQILHYCTCNNWTQSIFPFHIGSLVAHHILRCIFDTIPVFNETEIFFLFLFFSSESFSQLVFSVWPGSHAFVSFVSCLVDIPCHTSQNDRVVGIWETLFPKEKMHQVAGTLKKTYATQPNLTNSSCKLLVLLLLEVTKKCILGCLK